MARHLTVTSKRFLIEGTTLRFILTDGTLLNEGWVLIKGIALSDSTMLVEGLLGTIRWHATE